MKTDQIELIFNLFKKLKTTKNKSIVNFKEIDHYVQRQQTTLKILFNKAAQFDSISQAT